MDSTLLKNNLRSSSQTRYLLRSACKDICCCDSSHGNTRKSFSKVVSKAITQTSNIAVPKNKLTKKIKKIKKIEKKISQPKTKKVQPKKNNFPFKNAQIQASQPIEVKEVPTIKYPSIFSAQSAVISSNYLFINPVKGYHSNNEQKKFDDDEELNNTQGCSTNQMSIESFDIDKKMSLEIKIDSKALQLNQDSTLIVPINLIFDVDSVDNANKAAADIIFVIDRSGSMAGSKMNQVKKTLTFVLDLFSEKDRVSIVAFDYSAERLTPLLKMTSENKQITLQELNKINASGGTSIPSGIKIAFDIMQQRKHINDVTSIFLLSDGLDGTDTEKDLQQKVNNFKSNSLFTINTFGYGTDYDPKLMSFISNLKDGNFYFIERLNSLDECFVDCIGNLFSAVGENVVLQIQPEQSDLLPNLQFTKAYGVEGSWKVLGNTYTTEMIHLISGKKKTNVLEMKIPKLDKQVFKDIKSIKIASATITLKGLKNSKKVDIIKKAELEILLDSQDTNEQIERDNQEILFNHFRVKGAEILDEARKVADTRKFDDAKKLLENLKEDIGNSLNDHSNTQSLLKDIEEAIGNVDAGNYDINGKHYLYQNYKAQMEERSTVTANLQNRSSFQSSLVAEVMNKKNEKDKAQNLLQLI